MAGRRLLVVFIVFAVVLLLSSARKEEASERSSLQGNERRIGSRSSWDLVNVSKRKVPNGADPIHNRFSPFSLFFRSMTCSLTGFASLLSQAYSDVLSLSNTELSQTQVFSSNRVPSLSNPRTWFQVFDLLSLLSFQSDSLFLPSLAPDSLVLLQTDTLSSLFKQTLSFSLL